MNVRCNSQAPHNYRMKLPVWRVTPAKLAASALRQPAAYAER
jgi:hypothetical protein